MPASSAWERYHPVALNIVVQLVFGGYIVVTSAALKHSTIHPLVFALYRDLAASLQLGGWAWLAESRKPPCARKLWPEEADRVHFLLVGLLCVWGCQGMSALALDNLPAAYVGLLTPGQPIAATAVAVLAGMEAFPPRAGSSWAKGAGIAVTVGGAMAMGALAHTSVGGGKSVVEQSKNFAAGSVFVTLLLVSGGCFAVYQKVLLRTYPPLVVAAWSYACGTCILALSAVTAATDPSDWAVDSLPLLCAVAYAATLASVFTYAAMAYINKKTSPVLLIAFNPLQGLFAALLASAFLGDPLGLPEAVGGVTISAGLLLTVAGKLGEAREGEGKGEGEREGEEGQKGDECGQALLELGERREEGEDGPQ